MGNVEVAYKVFFVIVTEDSLLERLDGRIGRDGERLRALEPETTHKQSEELEAPWKTI